MDRLVRDERGSVLIMTVIAMLIMGVLSVSFALLSDVESKIGVNFKLQAQAEALAEAALERARDVVRTANTTPQGFTPWLSSVVITDTLAGGQYKARVDNDCAAINLGPPAWFPASIQEPILPCNNALDTNQTAVITAWAEAGPGQIGRARVRAVVGVDNPWRHVCSDASADNNGYCNDPSNRNGNPTITPADPNDPNGPAAYDELPTPILGCSRVAPGLHRLPAYTLAQQHAGCQANPQMMAAPYPVPPLVAPRLVIMGDDPAVVANAQTCNAEPLPGNGNRYFGYFDCALTTYCRAVEGGVCPPGGDRPGCLRGPRYTLAFGGLPDTRVVPGHPNQIANNPGFTGAGALRWAEYDPATGTCVNQAGVPQLPGMVTDAAGGNVSWNQNVGSQALQFTTYIFNGTWSNGNNRQFYGTLVVEGNEVNNPCADKDFRVGGGNASQLWAGPNMVPAVAPWAGPRQYGYPIVALIYNPDLPLPTVVPAYAPQGTCSDMGSNNTRIYGMIYSGGHVEFNPLTMEGTVVAFEIQTQGSATYNYSNAYGAFTPPPGFPFGQGNQVAIIRKSFVVCTNYSDDTGGPTACN